MLLANRNPRFFSTQEIKIVTAAILSFLVLTTMAAAQTETVLHSFAGKRDGGYPVSGLVLDGQENLYGTTPGDRRTAMGYGTVFKVAPGGRETILYTFTGGTDGAYPLGNLLRDEAGNLYGAAQGGGSDNCVQGCGTIFEITPANTEKVLLSFTSGGSDPVGSLIRDSEGNLYGMTANGGTHSCGTVFSLTQTGTETVLYSFNCLSDGLGGTGGLTRDGSGALYGASIVGGSSTCGFGCGLVFEVTASDEFNLLYGFTSGPDGWEPNGNLIRDAQGNLYGTSRFGGSNPSCSSTLGCGTVFEITPSSTETVLYSFSGGADGSNPTGAGLVQDRQGNLYGTTYSGGVGSCYQGFGCGVVFKVTPSGTETVLYSFTGGADGGNPAANLILDAKGNLFGTTQIGGAQGYGTVFEVTP
jgi:uncharacterized repeat protein (TIGR03803 family)